jgi:hypothetical protein
VKRDFCFWSPYSGGVLPAQLISWNLAIIVRAEKLTVSTGAVKLARDEVGGGLEEYIGVVS